MNKELKKIIGDESNISHSKHDVISDTLHTISEKDNFTLADVANQQ